MKSLMLRERNISKESFCDTSFTAFNIVGGVGGIKILGDSMAS